MRFNLTSHCVALFLAGFVIIATISTSDSQTANLTPFSNPTNIALGGEVAEPTNLEIGPGFIGAQSVLRIMSELEPDARRGVQEQQVFSSASPGVVYIESALGSGSGTLISEDADILTNWHVIEGAGEILVAFLPDAGFDLSQAKVFSATIVRFDQVTDLALLKLGEPPPQSARVVTIGPPDSISIGSDVHAIGHPTGEAWTYTKGYVSQMRDDYEWTTESGLLHQADVVQTQTPINPGNSGGPLLDDSAALVGVNSFGATGEGLNFAVSSSEVQNFLVRTDNREAPRAQNASIATGECQAPVVGEGRPEEDDGYVEAIDMDCNGVADLYYFTPDIESEPILIFLDLNENEIPDGEIQDIDRDGKWDASFWDEDEDGNYEACGVHLDGALLPTSYAAC